MPTYTYTCKNCDHHVEKRQSFSDPPLTTCDQCGGTLRKIIHPVGIVFKGSGWYSTDSRASSSPTKTPDKSEAGAAGSPNGAKDGASGSKDDSSGGDKSSSADKANPTRDGSGSKSSAPASSPSPSPSTTSTKSGPAAEKS